MQLVLDVETTFQVDEDGDTDPSPYNSKNKLVYVGVKYNGSKRGWFFHHSVVPTTPGAREELQALLDRCTCLIGHNLKFDLQWLLEAGFIIPFEVMWDTMLAEYVLARGQKPGMSLDASCERRGLPAKDTRIDEYYAKKISTELIPAEIVEQYCLNDVEITSQLHDIQQELYLLAENCGLIPTVTMMNEMCFALTDMERNGICIDRKALADIKKEYLDEKTKLEQRIKEIVAATMGDTPINLDSPEQLSHVIYSRRVVDKHVWASVFNLGSELRGSVRKKKHFRKMGKGEFVAQVKENTQWLYKTKAEQCQNCIGRGRVQRIKVSGQPFKNLTTCSTCAGSGYVYTKLPQIAGLKVVPQGPEMASSGGFKSDGDTLETLCKTSTGLAKEFMEALKRLGAVSSYLTMYCDGIERNIRENGLLHTQFMQAVTATARLSSRGPNFQNMPRGSTFPVRKAVISRFPGGKVFSGDYGKLEFITAVFMSGDKQGLEDIKNDADIHMFTSECITKAGQPIDRQDAKPHTFKPLYGGMSGTPAEVAYYKSFLEKYVGICAWQRTLQDTAINKKVITLPTGRQYAFPNAVRTKWGTATGATQIKNYPVQGFATGDIVPCAVIDVWRLLRRSKSKSVLFLTVHDDIDIDIHPDELALLPQEVLRVMENVDKSLKQRYNIDLTIPLKCEGKLGDNWLEGQKVRC